MSSILSLLLLVGVGTALPSSGKPSKVSLATFPPNANHIFNAVHSSMRQWGSSLQHNGMSFFLATVPAGTQLYHGTAKENPLNGMEWLAFEPEHAMVFARPHRGPPPGPPPDESDRGPQQRLSFKPKLQDDDEDAKGWLHTYITAKDLRLLYVDGMSAAKTSNGTLDSSDRILFNDTLPDRIMQERERAETFCRLAHETWDDRLDGLIRMEAGFEIILCSFERNLKNACITQVKPSDNDYRGRGEPGRGGPPGGSPPNEGSWLRAITARYAGIGGGRVRLNFEHFVTAYQYGLDLFPGNIKLPRLAHLPTQKLEPMRQDLHDLIMTHETNETSFDWQSIVDMVIERYAHELKFLVSSDIPTLEALHKQLERLLGPFIDYSSRNSLVEADRCANQFIPAHAPTKGLAAHAVQSVAHTICSSLSRAWEETDHHAAVQGLQDLIEYLAWSTWKDCRGCKDEEICVVPIWPMGTVEDYEHPQCKNAQKPNGEGKKYWGGFGRGKGKGKPSGPGRREDEL